eukprot:TRINITY_DN30_c0_g5_i1.p1 TRINITY_DN30_c0_g5~~TRINITY_DN30_c0_g5_i1.p1  ORF type:complete len:724 (-),score=207.32 TRINITY_DN30_c0_g5_i1:196-2367(-)
MNQESLLEKVVRAVFQTVGPCCDTPDVRLVIENPAKLSPISLNHKEKMKLKAMIRKPGLNNEIGEFLRNFREMKRKADSSNADGRARKRSKGLPNQSAESKEPGKRKKNGNNKEANSSIQPMVILSNKPKEKFSDFAGIDSIVKKLKKLLIFPFVLKDAFQHLNHSNNIGTLLHGPPKSGKTSLARAVASELADVSYFEVNCSELVSSVTGHSERQIRDLFAGAIENAPSLILLDKLDAITPKSNKEIHRKIGGELSRCISELSDGNCIVRVIATTSDPTLINIEVRERFTKVLIPMPNRQTRGEILIKCLQIESEKVQVSDLIDIDSIIDITPAYAPGDIKLLVENASELALEDALNIIIYEAGITFDEDDDFMDRLLKYGPVPKDTLLAKMVIEQYHLIKATDSIIPVGKTEGFADSPNVQWDEIGALAGVREAIDSDLLRPLANPEWYGDDNKATGLLLYGPPGCGKTLVAKAVATGRGASFISVKGPELLNKYVGASEGAVRSVFARARACTPCIVFFDEIDSLVVKRGKDSNGVTDRVVNQLLTEMDGLDASGDVFVIGATNRMDLLDPAILRPGRLSKKVEVPLPSPDDRADILQTLLQKRKIETSSFDLSFIKTNSKAEGFSGADINQLVKDAWALAADELIERIAPAYGSAYKIPTQVRLDNPVLLKQEHLLKALESTVRSVSLKEERKYRRQARRIGGATPTPTTPQVLAQNDW